MLYNKSSLNFTKKLITVPKKGAEVVGLLENSPDTALYDIVILSQILNKSEISAVEYLAYLLLDEDKWVRYIAAKALGDIGDRRGVDSLIAALRDTDRDVRIAAMRSLWTIGKLGDTRAFRALLA